MSRTSNRAMTSAKAIAVAAGLIAPPALAAPVHLTDAQLGLSSAGASFTVTNRVSDQPGVAPITDPLLVNAWGLSQAPGGILWVSNNGSDTSTLYNPSTFAKVPLVVNVPGGPTGTTFVGIPDAFKLSHAMNSQTIFAFATEGGQILGWNPTVDLHNTVVKVSDPKSIFKGLTLADVRTIQFPTVGGGSPFASAESLIHAAPTLFAADFGQGVIEAFNSNFKKVNSFTDPALPPNFVPFNVQTLNGMLYVTFAQKTPGEHDENHGPGLGVVDVFDTGGHFARRLVTGGALNAPWGLAIAPQSFGKFAGALLVGNFGDGKINAYDPLTGRFLGQLDDGKANGIDGLWALRTGPNGTITFSAGPQEESHGLLGSIGPASPGWAASEVATMAEMHR